MTIVGTVHTHVVPDKEGLPVGTVARCGCGNEFEIDLMGEYNMPGWKPVAEGRLVDYPIGEEIVTGNYVPERPDIRARELAAADASADADADIRDAEPDSEGAEQGSGGSPSGDAQTG